MVHLRSSFQHIPDASSCTFSLTLTTIPLKYRSLRWFDIYACTSTPRDLPSSYLEHLACQQVRGTLKCCVSALSVPLFLLTFKPQLLPLLHLWTLLRSWPWWSFDFLAVFSNEILLTSITWRSLRALLLLTHILSFALIDVLSLQRLILLGSLSWYAANVPLDNHKR